MAQPFLPPPPSSTRRRQRRVSIETSAVVQQRHSPATQRPVESSAFPGPSRLVDFDCPAADPTASTEQLQTWTPQQSGQSSLFDATAVSSQPTSSNFSSYSQLQAASPQAPLVQTDGFTFQQLEFTEQTIQHPVQFGDFPPQLASLSPAVAPPAATLEWGGLSQAADASVTGNEPDDIDFQISQMEQELAQLDALSVQYEGDDYEDVVPDFRAIGTQEQKVNQTSQTAIYDFPRLPPPPCTGRKTSQVDPFDINQYSQSQQAPVVLDFDNVFPIGNSGAVSQAPFPPQPPTSEGESQYADVSEIRQRKSAKGGQRSTKANPLQVTHRAVHDFKARHDDEIDLDKGVPVTVEATAKDGWCTGTNVTTGRRGIFPSSCVLSISHPSLKKMLGMTNLTVPAKKRTECHYIPLPLHCHFHFIL